MGFAGNQLKYLGHDGLVFPDLYSWQTKRFYFPTRYKDLRHGLGGMLCVQNYLYDRGVGKSGLWAIKIAPATE